MAVAESKYPHFSYFDLRPVKCGAKAKDIYGAISNYLQTSGTFRGILKIK
jgi:hypothetical protein